MSRPTCRVLAIVIALSVFVLHPAPAAAWGFEAHHFIVDRAIELLPAAIRPFFEKHRTFVVAHTVDPDLWRTVGWEEEGPRHYLDMDAYGRFPFTDLPREYGTAIQKFGPETLKSNGLLPWRVEEMYGRLVRAFDDVTRGRTYSADNVRILASVLAHYVADGHVPLHAVLNHDGQLTKQHGIHSRFEAELFERYRKALKVAPRVEPPVTAPRDEMFDVLLESFKLAEPILDADRRAAAGRSEYDDGYFDALLAGTRPILERRLSDAVSAVAAFIVGAWERGGKPALPLDPRRRVRKIGEGR